jgi:hypothetical protein
MVVSVSTCTDGQCSNGYAALTTNSGYLASVTTVTGSCGSSSCPWLLQPQPGQFFNITFYSYLVGSESQSINAKYCHRLATLVDRTTQVRLTNTIVSILYFVFVHGNLFIGHYLRQLYMTDMNLPNTLLE